MIGEWRKSCFAFVGFSEAFCIAAGASSATPLAAVKAPSAFRLAASMIVAMMMTAVVSFADQV